MQQTAPGTSPIACANDVEMHEARENGDAFHLLLLVVAPASPMCHTCCVTADPLPTRRFVRRKCYTALTFWAFSDGVQAHTVEC